MNLRDPEGVRGGLLGQPFAITKIPRCLTKKNHEFTCRSGWGKGNPRRVIRRTGVGLRMPLETWPDLGRAGSGLGAARK